MNVFVMEIYRRGIYDGCDLYKTEERAERGAAVLLRPYVSKFKEEEHRKELDELFELRDYHNFVLRFHELRDQVAGEYLIGANVEIYEGEVCE